MLDGFVENIKMCELNCKDSLLQGLVVQFTLLNVILW